MMKHKKVALIAVIALVLGGAFYVCRHYAADVPTNEKARLAERIEQDAGEFTRGTVEHRSETEGKVVIIRETVRQEIRALSPDGLALAALAEIGLFRGSAGGGIDPGASGLDGGE